MLLRTLSSFEHVQGWRLHNLFGWTVSVFGHSNSGKEKRILLHLSRIFCISACCQWLLFLCWTSFKKSWLHLLYFPWWSIYTNCSFVSEPSLLQAAQLQLSQPFAVWQILKAFIWPFGGLTAVCPHLTSTQEPRTTTVIQMWFWIKHFRLNEMLS